MKSTGRRRRAPTGRQLLWFVGLWSAGVLGVGVLGFAIRAALGG